jgi:hypothetical protein
MGNEKFFKGVTELKQVLCDKLLNHDDMIRKDIS